MTVQPDGPSTKEIFGWDVRSWSPALDLWRESVATDKVLECLELGAGPGGPSLWLAAQGHHVICSNQRDTVSLASPLHDRFPAITTVEYMDVDILNIPWTNHFDVIVFRSVIGGVNPQGEVGQQQALDQILGALKPGGTLIFAENLRATPLHRLARTLGRGRRSAAWNYPTLARLRTYLAKFSRFDIHATGFAAMFGVTEKQRHFLAGVDEAVFNRVLPDSFKYVVYGVATK